MKSIKQSASLLNKTVDIITKVMMVSLFVGLAYIVYQTAYNEKKLTKEENKSLTALIFLMG